MFKRFKEHRVLTTSLGIVLALLVIIGASFFAQGSSGKIGKAAQGIVFTVEKPFVAARDFADSFKVRIFGFKEMVKENEALKEENSKLKEKLISESLKENELVELRELAEVLNYGFASENTGGVVSCNVCAMDSTDWFDMFTIDKGTNDGITRDAVVVIGNKLVGTVYEAGPNWSKVISIINQAQKVSFEVYRNVSMLGILEGDGNGALSGYMLDNDSKIVEGDVLITSNVGMFPEGIEIGKVTAVEYNEDTQIKTVSCEPSVNFKTVRKVTVLL